MSSYAILKNTTLELRRIILAALTSASDTSFGITTDSQITLSPPSSSVANNIRLSIFLYHIEPDGSLRNQRMLPDAATGLRLPPLALQLRYLITPLVKDEDINQLVLGRILQHFHDFPQVERINTDPLDNSFGGASPALRVSLEALSTRELYDIWSALSSPYRLSIGYLVRVAAIDSDKGVTPANRVVEKHIVVGRGES